MQPTQTKPSKRKPAGASPAHRLGSSPGKQHKPKRNGYLHASKGTDASAIRNSMPPAIKIPLRTQNAVQVDLLTLRKGVCLLDDENKILKALDDLFPMIGYQKEFKDNTRWNNNTPVAEVFHTLVFRMAKVFEGLKIVLKNNTYRFAIKEPVYFDVACPVMPVYWIAAIEKVKPKLFDLCFYLVAVMKHQVQINLWSEDNENYIFRNIEDNLAHLKLNGGSEDDIFVYEFAHDEYKDKGTATIFCNRLYKSGGSKRLWLQRFSEYTPETALEKLIYNWLLKGKELMEAGESIYKYISLPDEFSGDPEQYDEIPETPDQIVKFLWRTDDVWFEDFQGMVQSAADNQGAVPFYFNKVIEKASDWKALKECFPEKVMEFMSMGRNIEYKYKKVFSDPLKLRKELFKQKYLIDIL